MKKLSWPLIIILVLCALGLYQDMTSAPITSFLIPIILIAGVILLIKFPPNRWGKKNKRASATNSEAAKYKQAVKMQRQKMKQREPQQSQQATKTFPFKVIDGGRDDNDTPRYH